MPRRASRKSPPASVGILGDQPPNKRDVFRCNEPATILTIERHLTTVWQSSKWNVSMLLRPSSSIVHSARPVVRGAISSTNAGGMATAPTPAMRRFSFPPSGCNAAAIRFTPCRRANWRAADHNSSGIAVRPCRFRLQSSKRLVHPRSSASGFTAPHDHSSAGPAGSRMALPPTPRRLHAGSPKLRLRYHLKTVRLTFLRRRFNNSGRTTRRPGPASFSTNGSVKPCVPASSP
jgi:hypothetical protein